MTGSIPLKDWQDRAAKVLPAGGFGNFDPSVVISRGEAAHVWDADGTEYVDYLIGSGPMLVGHAHPEVLEVVQQLVAHGFTYFANNAHGIQLAEEIAGAVACADQVRFVSTGSEADMYAMRLARAHTGREKILKFEGGYHGMSGDALMSLAPEKRVNFPLAVPDSAGIPEAVRDGMLVAPFNDVDFVRGILEERGHEIAAVIVEPLQRLIPPEPGFHEMLRKETAKRGIVLIFDEVVTGFRLAYGGGQEKYGVTPDLCTMGKVIGGGFPLAAIAGKEEIMAHFDKAKVGAEGFTFQIGTLSGNPVASVAGLKTLEILKRPGAYEKIYANGTRIMTALNRELGAAGIAHQVVGEPVMFDVVFTGKPVKNYRDGAEGDPKQADIFNAVLRQHGILKSPGKFYISLALTEADLEQTEEAIAAAAKAVAVV